MTPDMIGHDRTVPDITGQSPDTIGQSPDTIGQQSDSHRTQSDIPDTTGHAGHNRTCRTLSNRTLSDIAEHGTVQSWSDIIGHSPDSQSDNRTVDRTVTGQSPDMTGHYRTVRHPGLRAFTVIEADLEAFSPGRAAAHDSHGRLAEGERAF